MGWAHPASRYMRQGNIFIGVYRSYEVGFSVVFEPDLMVFKRSIPCAYQGKKNPASRCGVFSMNASSSALSVTQLSTPESSSSMRFTAGAEVMNDRQTPSRKTTNAKINVKSCELSIPQPILPIISSSKFSDDLRQDNRFIAGMQCISWPIYHACPV